MFGGSATENVSRTNESGELSNSSPMVSRTMK